MNVVNLSPNEIEARSTKKVTLTCRIKIQFFAAAENTSVKWSFNNNLIYEGVYVIVNRRAHSHLVSMLFIPNMSKNYVGKYRCEYVNERNFFSLYDTAVVKLAPLYGSVKDPISNLAQTSQEMSMQYCYVNVVISV